MLALTGTARLREPRLLRFRLFSAAARLVTTGRRRILHRTPWTGEIPGALERLAFLPGPGLTSTFPSRRQHHRPRTGEPGAHPARQSLHRPAHHQPWKAKRPANTAGRPSPRPWPGSRSRRGFPCQRGRARWSRRIALRSTSWCGCRRCRTSPGPGCGASRRWPGVPRAMGAHGVAASAPLFEHSPVPPGLIPLCRRLTVITSGGRVGQEEVADGVHHGMVAAAGLWPCRAARIGPGCAVRIARGRPCRVPRGPGEGKLAAFAVRFAGLCRGGVRGHRLPCGLLGFRVRHLPPGARRLQPSGDLG